MKKGFTDFNSGGLRAGIYFFIFVAAFFCFAALFQGVTGTFADKESALFYSVSSLSAPFALFAVLFFAKKLFSENTANLLKTEKFTRSFLGLAVILSFGMLFGLGFINDAFLKLLDVFGVSLSGATVKLNDAGDYILCVFSLCALPAIAEELFFRGVLLSPLKNAGFFAAAFISALFFAFYHCSLAQFFYQLIFGFFLAALTIRAGSVFPAIVSHFLNNFAVLSFEYFEIGVNFYYIPYILTGLAFLAAFCFILYVFKTNKAEKIKGETERAIIPFGILGLIFCAVIIAVNISV